MVKYANWFAKIVKKQMHRKILVFLIFALSCLSAYSRPVRPGIYTMHQPDGSSFQARCFGDEFIRIKTTLDGHAIVQGADGWWEYAVFDSQGFRHCSGFRVGSDIPDEVLTNSRNIPYDRIHAHAQELRSAGDLRRPSEAPVLTKGEGIVRHGLVILAEFKDVGFLHTRDDFMDMLSKDGYDLNGATGSAREYFEDQFSGMMDFSFEVSEKVTLSGRRAYYGSNNKSGNDSRPAEMIKEACMLAYEQGVDFSLYDYDNDGYVDNIFVFFAGEDEAENPDKEELIWSHAWYIESGAGLELELNGKKIDRYACTAELSYGNMTGIGTFCHEYSHTFGLPDFYDTDYDKNGLSAGMWTWTSLMDGGNMNNKSNTPPYFNAVERQLLGITEPIIIEEDGTYILEPLHTSNKVYRIDTGTPGEYYLIEGRKETGWDTYIGGSGMLIYHIDRSANYLRRWNYDNTVNAYADHQCADVLEADGRTDRFNSSYEYTLNLRNIGGIFFPNANTETVRFRNASASSDIRMTNIRQEGDDIRFSIVGFSDESTPPKAMNLKAEAFMDAAIITFESDREFLGDATVCWGRTDQSTEEIIVKPYEPGKYSVTLTGLTAGNKTYTASVYFETGGIAGESRKISFMTSKAAPVDWPYIFVGKNRALEDGTFAKGTRIALMACNTSHAEEVTWTFNDEEITPEGDGYFTLERSGMLKAHVYWADGTEDIIEKKINIAVTE